MILLQINDFLKIVIQNLIYFIKYDIKIYMLIMLWGRHMQFGMNIDTNKLK